MPGITKRQAAMSEQQDDSNPYAPPEADLASPEVSPSSELGELEAIRKRYLNHEASIKSIGSLFDLAALLSGLVIVTRVLTTIINAGVANTLFGFETFASIGALALFIALGRGFSGLKSWARWVTSALATLSLLTSIGGIGFLFFRGVRPIPFSILGVIGQALIPSYILYLLLSRKGNYVFSHEYQAIVRATPHIKYKTSCMLKVALGVIVLFVIFGIVAFGLRF